jgi:hypothetical protein
VIALLAATLLTWTDPSASLPPTLRPEGTALAYDRVAARSDLRWVSFAALGDTLELGPVVVTLKDGRTLRAVESFAVGPAPAMQVIPFNAGVRLPADRLWRLGYHGRDVGVVFAAFAEQFALRDVASVTSTPGR